MKKKILLAGLILGLIVIIAACTPATQVEAPVVEAPDCPPRRAMPGPGDRYSVYRDVGCIRSLG
jgi:hypothetical protein